VSNCGEASAKQKFEANGFPVFHTRFIRPTDIVRRIALESGGFLIERLSLSSDPKSSSRVPLIWFHNRVSQSQIPSRRQQARYGLHVSPRAWNDPGPDWRVVSCRLIAVRNWRGCPPGQNVDEGYFASLGGAPLVSVMKSADLRYRNNGSAFR